jgi:hypothetical protein
MRQKTLEEPHHDCTQDGRKARQAVPIRAQQKTHDHLLVASRRAHSRGALLPHVRAAGDYPTATAAPQARVAGPARATAKVRGSCLQKRPRGVEEPEAPRCHTNSHIQVCHQRSTREYFRRRLKSKQRRVRDLPGRALREIDVFVLRSAFNRVTQSICDTNSHCRSTECPRPTAHAPRF